MNPRFTSPEEKSTLRERLAYLENKNEALCLEVSHLTEQNTKLSDQIEVSVILSIFHFSLFY